MKARRDVEIDWLTSDFNEIKTNVLDDTKNCTLLVSTQKHGVTYVPEEHSQRLVCSKRSRRVYTHDP